MDACRDRAEARFEACQGIRGNSHMIMQDKNSLQIADLILQWLEKQVSKRSVGSN